jgi:CHAT domain-containing protein/Tfp pilus assembly protein PilF
MNRGTERNSKSAPILLLAMIVAAGARLNPTHWLEAKQAQPVQPADNNAVVDLEPDHRVHGEFVRDEKHSYRLMLAADALADVQLEQHGVELSIRLLNRDGSELVNLTNPTLPGEARELTFIAPAAGEYLLVVSPAAHNAAIGQYEVLFASPRVPSSSERTLEEARVLAMTATELTRQGRYDDALQPATRSLDLRESVLGPEHRLVADSLHQLADLHNNKGNYQESESINLRALAIREKTLGADHPDVAESLVSLGVVSDGKGEYARAESSLQRALGILEHALGPIHASVGAALGSSGRLYTDKGEYTKAESVLQHALEIQERALGADHLAVGTTVGNLGALNYFRGDYASAESYYRRALSICEKQLGPEHPNVGKSVHNLAVVYDRTGDYAQAEPLYQRAVTTWEKSLGSDHPNVATALNNLADLYGKKGDNAKGIPLYWRALAIREKRLGANHRDVAWTLSHLGQALLGKGDDAQAVSLQRRALAIREQALGPDHPDVADSLRKLAGLLMRQGEYAKAEPLFRRAAAILEKALGPNHSDVAQVLNNLAELYGQERDYEHAEPLYRRALAIGEGSVGPAHPDVAVSLNGLAAWYRRNGDVEQALAYLTRYLDITERNLTRNLPLGSERQKIGYLRLFSFDTDNALSMHLLRAPADPAAVHLALTTLLRRKGRALDSMAENVATLRSRATLEDQALFDHLLDTRSQYATLILRGPQKDEVAYQERARQLEERIDGLEAELSLRSAQFRAQSRSVTLEAVQAALPVGATLVEYALYRSTEPEAVGGDNEPRYAAYLLARQHPPRWVDLGKASDIDRAIQAWRRALRDPHRTDVTRRGRAVDQKVMQPVRELLEPSQHLLISPDGALNLIPFAALVDEHGRYLVEQYTITYLTSGRDLLRLEIPRKSRTAPVVVADPTFGDPAIVATRSGSTFDSSQMFFGPLPGVIAEVEALRALLPKSVFLTKQRATKSALMHVTGPSILHVATHGFFLRDAQSSDTASPPPPIDSDRTRLAKGVGLHVENPLLRSGLALADANRGAAGSADGVLTALEAADLDLWGTQLVVLSACDTGVGEIRNIEGVYGLRRALVLAGSESQMMSLWPVSDTSTRDLVVGYYSSVLGGRGRGDALRDVQLNMIRARSRAHPYYWAGFILSGQWAKIDLWP